MSEGELEPLAKAAFDAFAKHGFARTTMADIAAAAGMSRPALYLRVSNKEELLRLVADTLLAESLRTARAARTVEGVLTAKLDLTLELAGRSEHASELLEVYHRVAPEAVDSYLKELAGILAGVLGGAGAGRKRADTLADALVAALLGLELTALQDADRARMLLHELTRTVLAGL